MTSDILKKIERMIFNTKNDVIIWKRISPTNYEWKNNVSRDYQEETERLISNTEINFSIQKTEGNYLMIGYQIRYFFIVTDINNKETLLNIESHTEQNEEIILLLEKLFDEITEQHNRKVLLFLNKVIE